MTKKVYIVMVDWGDEWHNWKVFDTREKAEELVRKCERVETHDTYAIDEYEVE